MKGVPDCKRSPPRTARVRVYVYAENDTHTSWKQAASPLRITQCATCPGSEWHPIHPHDAWRASRGVPFSL